MNGVGIESGNINDLVGVQLGEMTSSVDNEKNTKVTETDKQISTIFKLSIPFHSQETIDIKELDLYSRVSFQEVIQEQESQNFPYFLALTRDSSGKIEASDGTSLLRNYFKYGRRISPITQRPIIEAQIYQIDHLKDQIFKYLGNLSTIKENQGHWLKFINACDPNLNPLDRGQERYYMGYAFEKGKKTTLGNWWVEPDLKKAFFWYNKSKEDQYFGGPLALAAWYEYGNSEVKASNEQLFENFKLVLDWIPENYHALPAICQYIRNFYEKTGKTVSTENELKKYQYLLEKIKHKQNLNLK